MKKVLASACFLILSSIQWAFGQNSVLQLDSLVVTVISQEKLTVHRTVRGAILDKKGDGNLDFVEYVPAGSSLKSFSASVRDGNGKIFKKYSLKDVASTESTRATADDVTTKYLGFQSNAYPYTVEFTYDLVFSEGFQYIPPFVPRCMPGQKMERAVFSLITPHDYGFSWKVLNSDIKPDILENKSNVSTTWVISNLAPIPKGGFVPDEVDLLPIICAVPDNFTWQKRRGTLKSIEEYGKWKWNLIEESSTCPDELKKKVHQLTDGLSCRYDKISALYAYMQKEYRYVSIQLGIGGQKPMTPEEVFNNKFGDCKALTNLMKTMLRAIGIESCYVEIGTHFRHQFHDMAFPGFKDHAILKIPDDEGDMWIECTSSTLPMGYVHSSMAGHECYVYEGGSVHIETVPQYNENDNLYCKVANVKVQEDGSAQIEVKDSYSGLMFEKIFPFKDFRADKKTDFLREEVGFPLADISAVECVCKEGKPSPTFELSYKASVPKFASKSGSKFLIPFCSPHDEQSLLKEDDRIVPYYNYNGSRRKEIITVELPDGWSFERIPADTDISNQFGNCSLSVNLADGNLLVINIDQTKHEGIYPVEAFDDINTVCGFFQNLARIKIPLAKDQEGSRL